ncbi:MAG: ComF family protein [Parcubacteria group bacterium]
MLKKSSYQQTKAFLLDTLFPPKCINCNVYTFERLPNGDTVSLCEVCLDKIPILKEFKCAFCKSITADGITCIACARKHALDQMIAVSSYKDPLAVRIMKTMKYRFVSSIACELARLMAGYINEFNLLPRNQNYIIIPVPLHKRRLRWRGFNQAKLIARGLNNYLNFPIDTASVQRTRNTKPQAEIEDLIQRSHNAHNAFVYIGSPLPNDTTVLLIDDITTTGSTLDNCAQVLKEHGNASRVIGIVFAR